MQISPCIKLSKYIFTNRFKWSWFPQDKCIIFDNICSFLIISTCVLIQISKLFVSYIWCFKTCLSNRESILIFNVKPVVCDHAILIIYGHILLVQSNPDCVACMGQFKQYFIVPILWMCEKCMKKTTLPFPGPGSLKFILFHCSVSGNLTLIGHAKGPFTLTFYLTNNRK